MSKSASEDIEGTSNSIDVSPHLRIKQEWEKLFFGRYYEIIRGINIKLLDVNVDIGFQPDLESIFKGWEIGYGPVNACLTPE